MLTISILILLKDFSIACYETCDFQLSGRIFGPSDSKILHFFLQRCRKPLSKRFLSIFSFFLASFRKSLIFFSKIFHAFCKVVVSP